jgi:predicted nucleic acid-binding protein
MPTADQTTQPIPATTFLDASFLVNLVQLSAPKTSAGGVTDITRHEISFKRWGEIQKVLENSEGANCYCSPMALQEFYYACAHNLLRFYKGQPIEAIDHADLRLEIEQLLAGDAVAKEEAAAFTHPSPRFIMAMLPIIERKSKAILLSITLVDDCCSCGSLDFVDLLRKGLLGPADCVIVVSAKRAGAKAILHDDRHFASACPFLHTIDITAIND